MLPDVWIDNGPGKDRVLRRLLTTKLLGALASGIFKCNYSNTNVRVLFKVRDRESCSRRINLIFIHNSSAFDKKRQWGLCHICHIMRMLMTRLTSSSSRRRRPVGERGVGNPIRGGESVGVGIHFFSDLGLDEALLAE